MKYVLFVCTHNAGRSQMAQAFFERYAPADVRAESAGQEPADAIWPEVVEAMREVGIDLAGRRPKKLDLEMQLHADWAVTLACGGTCPYVPGVVEEWDVPDPAGRPLEEVRAIRDDLERRVRDLVENRLDAIRADRSAHARRLGQLLPSLVAEFDGVRAPDEIRACADAVLTRYDEVPVRSFLLTLADRATRECLRAEGCYELAG
ncbi:MAG TPA: arsenate reductase ArsC [Gaiellaceae bacterium]|nr:arsenate reductase ArsC [Gaiellaceae bacterium]